MTWIKLIVLGLVLTSCTLTPRYRVYDSGPVYRAHPYKAGIFIRDDGRIYQDKRYRDKECHVDYTEGCF